MAKTCTHCESKSDIPFAAYEAGEVRHERRERRLVVSLVIAILVVFLCNASWLYAWTQYDYSSEEIVIEQGATDGGNANYIGNDGDIVNGTTDNYDPAPPENAQE